MDYGCSFIIVNNIIFSKTIYYIIVGMFDTYESHRMKLHRGMEIERNGMGQEKGK